MIEAQARKWPLTVLVSVGVYRRLAAVSRRSGVPRNVLAALALEDWLRRLYLAEPVARALADRAVVYPLSRVGERVGERRDYAEIARQARLVQRAEELRPLIAALEASPRLRAAGDAFALSLPN